MLSIDQAKLLSSLVYVVALLPDSHPAFGSHMGREPGNDSMPVHFQVSLLCRMLPRSVLILGAYLVVLALFTTYCNAQDVHRTIEGEYGGGCEIS